MNYNIDKEKNELKCCNCDSKKWEHLKDDEDSICGIADQTLKLKVKCQDCGAIYCGIYEEMILDLSPDTMWVHIFDDQLTAFNTYNKNFVLTSVEKQ